jgi:hypothetical protein
VVSQTAAPPPAVRHADDCVPELARVYVAVGSDGTRGYWCSFCQQGVTVFPFVPVIATPRPG